MAYICIFTERKKQADRYRELLKAIFNEFISNIHNKTQTKRPQLHSQNISDTKKPTI